MWSVKISSQEGKKIVRPWFGLGKMVEKLGRVGYVLRAEVGTQKVRDHTNRLRKISDSIVETGDPKQGIFPDSLRTLSRIAGTE